jgi:hypothetical protein
VKPVRDGLAKVLRIDRVEKQAELVEDKPLVPGAELALARQVGGQPVPGVEPGVLVDDSVAGQIQEEHVEQAHSVAASAAAGQKLPDESLDFQSDNSPALVLVCRCDG